jgi:hypothetical protein
MPTRDEYVDVIKSAFETIIKTVLKRELIKLIPWFAGGVGGVIAGYVIGIIADMLVKAGEMLAFFTFIDVRTSQEGRDWYAAAKANRDAQRGNATPEEKQRAEENLIANHKVFVKWASK